MAASDYRLIGLDSIALGACRTSKPGMPAAGSLTSVFAFVPDSAVLAIAMPAKTEIMVEDSDFPDIVIHTAGEKMFEWAIRDLQPHSFVLGMGGTSGATFWKAPNDAVIVTEKSLRAVSKDYNGTHVVIDCVHVNLRSGAQLRFSKSDSGILSFSADILRPKALTTDVPIYLKWE